LITCVWLSALIAWWLSAANRAGESPQQLSTFSLTQELFFVCEPRSTSIRESSTRFAALLETIQSKEQLERRSPQRSEDTRRVPGGPVLDPDSARFGSRLPWLRAIIALGEPQTHAQQLDEELAAACCWPVRTPTGCLVRAPVLMVRANRCGVCGLSFAKPVVA
jgi:hypothetical protein